MKEKLRQIITDYGLKIIEEPKRLEAIINDLLINESKSDLFAIKLPLQQGLVLELKSRGKDFIPMFKYKLINEYNTNEEKAIFTTDIWAHVLFNQTIVIKRVEKTGTPKIVEQSPKQNLYTPQIIVPKNDFDPEMIYVEGSTFLMGSNDGSKDEKPVHSVTVDSFYIGKYQITQKQWKSVMSNNPSRFKGDKLPIECVSWNDVQEFITKLNLKTGKNYRLPTEAEWEYAARGGNKSRGDKYAGSNYIDAVAWYYGNSGRKTHPIGTKNPNELGIYDMTGNVWEWCQDWYDENYYKKSPNINPKGTRRGKSRVLRGGSWLNYDFDSRLSVRYRNDPNSMYFVYGFRLAQDYLFYNLKRF